MTEKAEEKAALLPPEAEGPLELGCCPVIPIIPAVGRAGSWGCDRLPPPAASARKKCCC